MSDENLRKEFEQWASKIPERYPLEWEAWQASAARIAELEGVVAMLRDGLEAAKELADKHDDAELAYGFQYALSATAQTAEEYRKRVQAEALKNASPYIRVFYPEAANMLIDMIDELRNPARQAVSGSVTFTASTTWGTRTEGKGEK